MIVRLQPRGCAPPFSRHAMMISAAPHCHRAEQQQKAEGNDTNPVYSFRWRLLISDEKECEDY
ncbi:MAG: hypothetical protein C4557_08385 [Anaerolineaceae bacterium]|jgi:hypothetical protein|nr:MAG: hypothetical protein C4557_08385 [Anaerolineaceae bacterium]